MPGLQPVSFTEQQPGVDPVAIERKRRLAEMLREQSQAPIQYQQNAPISWTQGLAKMLQAYGANKKEKEVDKESNTYRTQLAESIRGGGTLSEMADRMAQVNPELAMQLRIEEAKQQAKMQGENKFGNSPVWGQDEQGNWVAMQPSSGGGPLSVAQAPEGVKLARPQYEPGAQYQIAGAKQAGKEDVTMRNMPQMNQLEAQGAGLSEAAKQQAQTGAIVPQAQQTAVAAPIIAGGQAAATAITAPAEAEAKGEITPAAKKKGAQQRVAGNLKEAARLYSELNDAGAIINTAKGKGQNIAASIQSSGIGQAIGKMVGTKEQSLRNQINQIRPTIVNDIRQAAEMGAKGMDSEKELEFFLQAATDPKRDIQSNIAALYVLDDAYGLGQGFDNIDPSIVADLKREFKGNNSADKLTPEEQAEMEKLKKELNQ